MTLTADASPYSIEDGSSLSLYLLPAGTLIFRSVHLEVGVHMDTSMLAGAGLHKPGGQAADTYQNFPLLEGTVDVLDTRVTETSDFMIEEENPVEWLLRWHLVYGDNQNRVPMQTWDAEDWVDITNGSTIGDPIDLPDDYEDG